MAQARRASERNVFIDPVHKGTDGRHHLVMRFDSKAEATEFAALVTYVSGRFFASRGKIMCEAAPARNKRA